MTSTEKIEAYYNDRETQETLNGLFLDAKIALDEYNALVRKWNETHDEKIDELLIVHAV